MISSVIYKTLDAEECDQYEAYAHFFYGTIETEEEMLDEVVDYRIRQGDLFRKLAAMEAPYHNGLYNGGINISGKTGQPILIVNE